MVLSSLARLSFSIQNDLIESRLKIKLNASICIFYVRVCTCLCMCLALCGCQIHAFCINYSYCLSAKCWLYTVLVEWWEKEEVGIVARERVLNRSVESISTLVQRTTDKVNWQTIALNFEIPSYFSNCWMQIVWQQLLVGWLCMYGSLRP